MDFSFTPEEEAFRKEVVEFLDRKVTKEVATAKAGVSDAFGRVVALAHQVQGGVSIMEDHYMPLYSKQALGWQSGFGGAEFHREVIAQQLGF